MTRSLLHQTRRLLWTAGFLLLITFTDCAAANISTDTGKLSIVADGNVDLTVAHENDSSYKEVYNKKKGFLSSKSKLNIDQSQSDTAVGNTLSADSISIQAGRDLSATGASVVATNDVSLSAARDVTIRSAESTAAESHLSQTKKSGLSFSSSGIGIGSSKLNSNGSQQSTTQTASSIGSIDGDITIAAGKTYNQTGSDLLTPAGNIDITAGAVNISAAQETTSSQQSTTFKQSGLSIGISSPVINAVQTVSDMASAAKETSDPRMKALAAATAALAAKNGYDAFTAAQSAKPTGDAVRDTANQLGGLSLNISFGSSKSSSQSSSTQTTARGSSVVAGGDVNVTATDGDVNVVGSRLSAGRDAVLSAANEVNLLAAANTSNSQSSNKSSSASIGVSFSSTGGVSGSIGASKSKGSSNGNDVSWTESQLSAGNAAIVQSGSDTNLIGAQVKGKQVIADVGGNLNIESLQDTSTYADKQNGGGFSLNVGTQGVGGSVSVNKSKISSNYQSVIEQSGIVAGDDGFDVSVNGNTDLKGAVIASTTKATQDGNNSLITGSLTTSDINNQAAFSANGYSVSAGVGLNKQQDGSFKNAPTASAGSSSDSGSASSVTVSGISAGQVTITDNATQQQRTGKDAATTIALANRDVQVQENADGSTIVTDSNGNATAGTLAKIFDAEKVKRELNANIQITQAFSQVAPKAAADYAQSQSQDLKQQADQAEQSGDTAKAQQLRSEAAKWEEGGAYRIAMHAALGGLMSGDVSGALAGGATAAAAPLLNDLQAKVTETLTQSGMSSEAASAVAQAVGELTSTGVGSAIGGTGGAGAALAIDTNNRQLHSVEIDLIKKRAKDFAKLMRGDGNEPSPQEIQVAEERLLAEAQRLVDASVSDYKVDSPAISFLQNVVARDAIAANGGQDPVFVSSDGNWNTLFGANPNDFFNPNVYKDQGDPNKRAQAYQEIIKVFSNPNAVGETDPSRYLASYLDYANMTKMSNQVGKDGALCLTGIGCLAVNVNNFVDGVNALKSGNTKVGWAMIGLALVGGGASATMLKSEVAAVQNAVAKNVMVRELQAQGIKISPDEVLAMRRLPDGKIVWLEKGYQNPSDIKKGAGMEHIVAAHGNDFNNIGITSEELPKFLMQVINEGKVVEYQGAGTGRAIYATQLNGKTQYVAISVGKNGFIVGANPAGSAR